LIPEGEDFETYLEQRASENKKKEETGDVELFSLAVRVGKKKASEYRVNERWRDAKA